MQRTLLVVGLVLVALALLWPWLIKLHIGRLPGDFVFARGSFRFYFPLATCLLLSAALSIVLWLFRR
jgi:Protein of unknown function (DUF2905)